MKRDWKTYLLYGSVIVAVGILVYILIETIRLKNTGFETKTLWQCMELLIVPLFLAGGAFYLERSDRATDRNVAEYRAALELKTAEDRAKLEREIATDRQQEAALQAYLDRMAELLLEKELRTSENEEVRNVARIRTLTVLRGLDGKRKRMVLLFLKESGLIAQEPIIELNTASLNGAHLEMADLSNANLTTADLSGANLDRAILKEVNLRRSNLSSASLNGAYIVEANLRYADLSGADLSGAELSKTDLQGSILKSANLRKANLESADLRDANLTGADLHYAYLMSATISGEQLATAASLQGATMPDGTKHD